MIDKCEKQSGRSRANKLSQSHIYNEVFNSVENPQTIGEFYYCLRDSDNRMSDLQLEGNPLTNDFSYIRITVE
jgi:hypothetical protein